jgi:transformation/transcription domain-associated protein
VRHCLDIVLAGASTSTQICPAPGVHRLPPLIAPLGSSHKLTSGVRQPSGAGARALEMIVAHEEWLQDMREIRTGSILSPLRVLGFVSHELAYNMWIGIFPLLWHVLEEKGRHSIAITMQQLLAQDFHADQVCTSLICLTRTGLLPPARALAQLRLPA